MRTRKSDLSAESGRFGSVRPAMLASALVGLLVGVLPTQVFGQTARPGADDPNVVSLFFKFNSVELNARSRENLRTYLDNRGAQRRYLLVQGFGCERGGFANSLTAAESRSNAVQAMLIQAGVTRDRYRIAPGGVLRGEPREPHRRVVIRGYGDERSLEYALLRARELTRRLNVAKDRKKQEEILEQYLKLMRETPGPSETNIERVYWVAAIIILALLVLLLLLLLIFRNRNRREMTRRNQERAKHKLTPREAAELAAITGEEPIPVPPAKKSSVPPVAAKKPVEQEAGNREIVDGPRAHAKPAAKSPKEAPAVRQVRAVEPPGASLQESIRSKLNMASKKKSKSTSKTSGGKTASAKPISIGRAVEKSFENKSLSQLARSPINALEGLTPRHARMLEEGFGIKTIEDLAQLKYFEIARAIVVLSKYE